MLSRTFLPALGLLLLAGCTSIPRDTGLADVSDDVHRRTGQQIETFGNVHTLLQRQITAEDAVCAALMNNQNLRAVYEELGIAQADVMEAGLLANPTLAAEVRFPKYAVVPFELDVTQDVVQLLTMSLRTRLAGAAFAAAKMRVTDEVLKTIAETKAAYYRAQGAVAIVDLRQTTYRAADAAVDVAQGLHDAGNITDLALAAERAAAGESQLELRRSQADAEDAREELNGLMGVWGTDAAAWSVAPQLPELPGAQIDSKKLEAMAISQRADLAAAKSDVEVATRGARLAGYSVLGSGATIGAHLEKDPDGETTLGPAVEIPLPLFNQGQPAKSAAAARLRQKQRRYDALAVDVRTQVRRALNRMNAAHEQAEYVRTVLLPMHQQIVEQTQLQTNALQIGVFGLLQARQAQIDATRQHVESVRDYWIARAELERAAGGSLTLDTPLEK